MGKTMSIQSTGLKAYTNVMSDFKKVQDTFKEKSAAIPQSKPVEKSFADTFKDSLSKMPTKRQRLPLPRRHLFSL